MKLSNRTFARSKKSIVEMHKSTSQFSATMIGVHEERHNPSREMFIQEAQEISALLNGVHHARKLSHLQVNYPDTVERLSNLQAARTQSLAFSTSQTNLFPPQTSASSLNPKDQVREFKQTRLREYQDAMKNHLIEERFINFRKKEYYREMGRKAVVNQVIAGTAPAPRDVLFPHGASHEQILAITGSLKAPNPHIVPPEVPRPRKFRGDKGWI